ncbi:MAG: disulfide bond formation protein B [Alphaproteobacteria bacterium]
MASFVSPSSHTPRRVALALAACAAAILLGALAFQYLGGLAPCPLCTWQRYALIVAMMLALGSALAMDNTARVMLFLAGAAFVTSAGIGGFQVGVEQGWWQGTQGCAGGQPMAGTLDQLMTQVQGKPPARCDEVAWSLFGISLAGYNFLISLALAAVATVRGAVPEREK